MSIAKHVLVLLILTVGIQRLSGQTYKPSITSWTPSGAGFESTAALPHGAEIRILVVTTGHTAKSQGEVIVYPESPGYAVNPVARWPFVKNGQSLVFRVVQHAWRSVLHRGRNSESVSEGGLLYKAGRL